MKNLSKWPALLVVGEPIAKEQAAEIIIRTQDFYFCTNDNAFRDQLCEVIGLNDHYDFDAIDKICKEHNCLDIEFLVNSRIASCYIGGPHGWCNWDGTIRCSDYNIGKWPSMEDVLTEWRVIAAAFPFLKLKSQLFDGEYCEEESKPIIQFNIADGIVTIATIEDLGTVRDPLSSSLSFIDFNERGCTIDQFKWALEITSTKTKLSD